MKTEFREKSMKIEKTLTVYQEIADFFAQKPSDNQNMIMGTSFCKMDGKQFSLEYDSLLRGTDADIYIPLWASSCMGRGKILLDRTTVSVIQFYYKSGYRPCKMEGNPPDYIGEMFRYLAYLKAVEIYYNKNGLDHKDRDNQRNLFVEKYLLPTMKEISEAVVNAGKGTFTEFRLFMTCLKEFIMQKQAWEIWIAWEEYLKTGTGKERTERALNIWKDVIENGPGKSKELRPAETINTAGINNCGGKCVIRPKVQEGCMLSIATDDSRNNPQLRACVRGRGYRKTFLSSERLKYPMKRIGERGSGKFERISWEEAVRIIASEWRRITETYGPSSRYVMYSTGVTGVLRPANLIKRLLKLDGGFLDHYNSYSSACASYITPYIYGTAESGNSPSDILNTKLLILWGHNPAETIFGSELNYYISLLKEKDVKIIVIDPRFNESAVTYADQWIPIRPSTDAALADAMAYVIWSENLLDKKFMDRFCIGFDEEHMPDGIPYGESYFTYLSGEKDGIVKNPEWAGGITGVPAETIIKLAGDYASMKPACLLAGLGLQRTRNGEQTVRCLAALACMTGNVGIPGGSAAGAGWVNEHPFPGFRNELENPYQGKIPVFLWSKAIEHGTEMTSSEDGIKGVEKLSGNIKLIFNLAGNTLVNQHSDINDTIRILKDTKKCEFIVCSDIFMTPSAKFADIVLPAASVFENNNIVTPWKGANYILRNNKVIEPVFGCRFEWEWIKELSKELGMFEEFIDKKPDMELWLKEIYERYREKEKELPDYEEFCRQGGYQFKNNTVKIAFEKEIREPEQYQFQTPSGKIEIFSKLIYEMHNKELPAVPAYVPCEEGPDDLLRMKYPLQLIGWHTRRRCHSIHDNNEWMEELEMPALWIHTDDAEKRGISRGDTVKIFNDRGCIRIPVFVTHRIMKGVVAMSQGGWYTPDIKGTDIRGSINVLTTTRHPSPLAKGNPQHTNLVEVALA